MQLYSWYGNANQSEVGASVWKLPDFMNLSRTDPKLYNDLQWAQWPFLFLEGGEKDGCRAWKVDSPWDKALCLNQAVCHMWASVWGQSQGQIFQHIVSEYLCVTHAEIMISAIVGVNNIREYGTLWTFKRENITFFWFVSFWHTCKCLGVMKFERRLKYYQLNQQGIVHFRTDERSTQRDEQVS